MLKLYHDLKKKSKKKMGIIWNGVNFVDAEKNLC